MDFNEKFFDAGLIGGLLENYESDSDNSNTLNSDSDVEEEKYKLGGVEDENDYDTLMYMDGGSEGNEKIVALCEFIKSL